MKLIEKAILLARINEQKTLYEITNTGCSDCFCRNGQDLRNIDETNPCMAIWIANIGKIADASGIKEILLYRDAWGSPYIFDENEGESGPADCRHDNFYSPGPDGIYRYPDGTASADNILLRIPFYNTKECN